MNAYHRRLLASARKGPTTRRMVVPPEIHVQILAYAEQEALTPDEAVAYLLQVGLGYEKVNDRPRSEREVD